MEQSSFLERKSKNIFHSQLNAEYISDYYLY